MRTVLGVSSEHERQDDRRPPEALGPTHLAKAVLSWILVAIATLVIVWLLVFAATRGDVTGLLIVVAVGLVLVTLTLVRRRRR